jgi:hypothetical protein
MLAASYRNEIETENLPQRNNSKNDDELNKMLTVTIKEYEVKV